MAQLDIRIICRPTGRDRIWVDLIVLTDPLNLIVGSWVWTDRGEWYWVR